MKNENLIKNEVTQKLDKLIISFKKIEKNIKKAIKKLKQIDMKYYETI